MRRLVYLGFLVAATGTAAGNPLALARFGGLRGDPVYSGAFALYWNPASLAAPGFDFAVDGQLLARQASYDRDADANHIPEALRAANSGRGTISTVGVVPGIAGRVGRRFAAVDVALGAGVFVETGGAASWDKNLRAPPGAPGAIDGPQRFSSIDASLIVVDLGLGLAVRHRATGLSFGATPILTVASFATLRARDIDRSEDLVDANGNLKEGRAYFSGRGVGFSFVAGARWDIAPRFAVAVTYQRGAQLRLDGDLAVAFGTQAPASQRAYLVLPIADTLRVGASLPIARRLVLRPMLEWARWSTLKQHTFSSAVDGAPLLVIDRQFGDAISGRLRADVRLSDRVRLMLGAGVERGPTPARTMEPGFGEGNSVEAGAGATVALTPHVDLSATFMFHYFLPRTVGNSVHQPSANGTYLDQREYLIVDLEIHGWRPALD